MAEESMGPGLTKEEVDNVFKECWGYDGWSGGDPGYAVADAATRKALWCALEFVKGYVETGAPSINLASSMEDFLGIEPWTSATNS